jgi:hypothetical protein
MAVLALPALRSVDTEKNLHSPFALSDFYFCPKEKIKIVRRVGEYSNMDFTIRSETTE